MTQKQLCTGLTDAQVMESRIRYGTNLLTPPAKTPLWKQFFGKFNDRLILILLVAGMLSIGISCYEFCYMGKEAFVFFEPAGLFVAILLATGLSFFFEMKADKAFSVLNEIKDEDPVQAIRNGQVVCITKKDVVVGDVLMVNTGDEVPADAELLWAASLSVDESTLTGELLCSKTVDEAAFDVEATFPSNHIMRGTKVMEGHGVCRVFAVGDATEHGKVFKAARIDDGTETPLDRQLARLSALISKVSYGLAVLIVAGRLLMYFSGVDGFDWVSLTSYVLQSLMLAVTVVVVAVPEGLPMAVTLALAYSMRRMLATHNLVRKMHACETMGAVTVICTDKTGTLTQNRMKVYRTDFYALDYTQMPFGGRLADLIVESIVLNSTAQLDVSREDQVKVLGNPTEGALLLWLREHGIDYLDIRKRSHRLEELPFTTERKFMATVVRRANGERVLFVKGAPEIVQGLCASVQGNIDTAILNEQLLTYQRQAMRTLGFAYQVLGEQEPAIEEDRIVACNLTFMGIVAISDPVREDVPDAIKTCFNAGIGVKIVTGDTPGTAREIGRQIGLWRETDGEENIITGPAFAALSDEEMLERVESIKIIARARPMDKRRLVETLQRCQHVVAVTGDGTNDAPALNAADVGLSMGDGTAVAKEASDITIVNNAFSSIGRAVMWGRSLYRNIQRFILFQMIVNVTACLTVLVGAFMGMDSPLTITQMLWVNLIMDTFAAVALASLPPEEAVMQDKPRDKQTFIITPAMRWGILGIGGAFFLLLIGLVYVFERNSVTSLMDLLALPGLGVCNGLSPYELSLIFTVFVMLQFWNMFNARAFATGRSAFNLKGCYGFGLIACLIIIGQVLIVSVGGSFFNVVPLRIMDWAIIIVATSAVLWIGEIIRLLKGK
ncbi:MAG: calcium-translocating P-type ATPase, PMCA-type [Oxalobacter sp.]